MKRKTFFMLAGITASPFVTVGAITFYRRWLEWWYAHPIGMTVIAAENMSYAAMFGVLVMLLFTLINWWSSDAPDRYGPSNQKKKLRTLWWEAEERV